MKIATYNIWNSEAGMPIRNKYIMEEIQKCKADVICLQEVCNRKLAESIANHIGYPYWYFDNYSNDEEGLCILSQIPFEECDSWINTSNSIYCSLMYKGKKVSVVNIHLPSDSVRERELQIVNSVAAVDKKQYDYVYMAGDFNCGDSSDVQRFLAGECMLNNHESMPCWYDLALSYAELSQTDIEYTLNFRENPRFEKNTIETNARFDRILLRNTYPYDFPVLSKCTVFGKTIYRDIGLAASDHYGVMVEID